MPTARAEVKNVWIRSIILGMGASLVTTLALVVLFALLMQMMDLDEVIITSINQIIKVLSIMIGSFVMTHAGIRGYVAGLLCGGLYMLIGVGVFCTLEGTILPMMVMAGDVGLGLATGALSGMLAASLYKS